VVLWWKVLGVLGYRRAILWERREIGDGVGVSPPQAVELGLLDADEVEEYLAFHPQATRPELERRLAAGDRCHVARTMGRLIAVRWVSFTEARVPYLELTFRVGGREVFVYDAFSDPAWRGRGVSRALYHAMNARLRSEGYGSVLSVTMRDNREGVEFTSSTSTPVASLVSVGFGRFRRHFRRPV